MRRLKDLVKKTTRDLRKRQTEAEEIVWHRLRNRKLMGAKFMRQHPVVFKWNGRKRFLVADFYCHEAKLVVELDGPVHLNQRDYDEVREYVLKSLGLNIIRFNNQTIENNLEKVIYTINKCLKASRSPSLCKRGGYRG